MDSSQLLDDIKQLLHAEISQSEQRLRDEIKSSEQRLSVDISQLCDEMHDGFAGIAEIITSTNDVLENHEQRVGKLEVKTA